MRLASGDSGAPAEMERFAQPGRGRSSHDGDRVRGRRFVDHYAYSHADANPDTDLYADSGRDLHDRRYRYARHGALARNPGHRDCYSGFVKASKEGRG